MITREEELEAQALYKRGWSISAIAAHLGRDRKTIRAYLNGERTPGQRARSGADVFEPFAAYVGQRLADDPHVWTTAILDELLGLGYTGSYQSLTRAIRIRGLRPVCTDCAAGRAREAAVIEHPPGEETQWDWLELPHPPSSWGLDGDVHLLVGSLAHSSRWRAALATCEDQPHLIEAIDAVVRRLGGISTYWRFDRMATVAHPASGEVTASFAAVARHYGAGVRVCPPRRGQRKGVVEKGNHSLAQRWWRTLADETTFAGAQASLDAFCADVGDGRSRRREGVKVTVGQLAESEPLAPVPLAPFPAVISAERTISAQALVSFRGNRYSVPPGMSGRVVVVSARLGDGVVQVATEAGVVLARHRRAPDGAGQMVRADEHVAALEKAVLASFGEAAPCRGKTRRPPSAAARAQAAALTGSVGGQGVVVDFAAYAAAVRPLTPSAPAMAAAARTEATEEAP